MRRSLRLGVRFSGANLICGCSGRVGSLNKGTRAGGKLYGEGEGRGGGLENKKGRKVVEEGGV